MPKTLSLREVIGKGLFPLTVWQKNSAFVEELLNARPREGKIYRHVDVENPFEGAPAQWPFPQLYLGKKSSFLLYEDIIYSIDESNWTASPITTYSLNESYGAECISNGTFSGNSTGWTLQSSWIYLDGRLQFNYVNEESRLASQPSASQAIPLVPGKLYRVSYDVHSIDMGAIRIRIGDSLGFWRTTPGTYVEYLMCPADNTVSIEGSGIVHPDGLCNGVVDNISVMEVLIEEEPIIEGGIWHIADFQDGIFFFNGACVVCRFTNDGPYYCIPRALAISGCATRGRLMLGGLGQDFFDSSWVDSWNRLCRHAPIQYQVNPQRGDMVWWSSIGGGDVRMVLDRRFAREGHLEYMKGETVEEEYLLDMWYRNESGTMTMPYQGNVLGVLPLGAGVVVYGEQGIAALQQYSTPDPTFGLVHIAEYGVAGRGAFGGHVGQHIFIDQEGVLWSLNADFSRTRLGYEHYLSDLLDSDILISYDEHDRLFYICGVDEGPRCFVYSEEGMAEIHQAVSGIGRRGEDRLGFVFSNNETFFYLTTGIFDLGSRDIKTLESIQIVSEYDILPNYSITIRYRMLDSTDWYETPSFPLDYKGRATIYVTGLEFKIIVEAPDYYNVSLEDIIVGFNVVERHSLKTYLGV